MPDVSIVLPTYNRADSLPRAIDSVVAQSFGEW
jgi:glycosyltransferase involved in cell wall biosynthesis